MEITKEQNEIYELVKHEKDREKIIHYKNNRNKLLKKFGNYPLYFIVMLTSFLLTISTLLIFILYTEFRYNILIKFSQLEPYYTIFLSLFSIIFFFIYFISFSLCITLHDKKLELSYIDNTKK